MTASHPPLPVAHPATDLAEHLGALRRLARQLVSDPQDADDAVQETCLRALENRPKSLDRLRGWLEAVLRNVVRRGYRQRQRSSRREHAVAREGMAQPTIDVLVRQQHLGALTSAVGSLPIDLQEVLFLRYFEDLAPRHIARRTNRPVASVYRSLENAKAHLRRELQREDPDWRRGLALLVGLRPTATTLIVGGGIIVSKKLLAVAGAAFTFVLLYSIDPFAPEVDAETVPDVSVDPIRIESSAAETPKAEGRTSVAERTEQPETKTPVDDLATHEFELEVHARSADDLPAANTAVLLAPEHHPLNQANTNADGVLRIKFLGRNPSMTLCLGCISDVTSGARLRRVRLQAGVVQRVAIRSNNKLQAVHRVALRIFNVSRLGNDLGLGDFDVALANAPRIHTDESGLSWFVAGAEFREPDAKRVHGAMNLARVRTLHNHRIAFDVHSRALDAVRAQLKAASRKRVLSGIVRDSSGRPAPNALVFAGERGHCRTEKDGRFELKFSAADGEVVKVRAGGGELGLATTELSVDQVETLHWEPQLNRGLELFGQLVDAAGKPLKGWYVEIRPEDGTPWIDATMTAKDGTFSIPNVPDRPYHVALLPPTAKVARVHRAGVEPGREHVIQIVKDVTFGRLKLQPRTTSGKTVPDTTLQIWDDSLDEGFLFPLRGNQLLPAGSFRIVGGARGFATRNLTEITVTGGGQTIDVGILDLGERTVLAAKKTDGETEPKQRVLYHLHSAVPTRVTVKRGKRMAMPPGDYRMVQGETATDLKLDPGTNSLPSGTTR